MRRVSNRYSIHSCKQLCAVSPGYPEERHRQGSLFCDREQKHHFDSKRRFFGFRSDGAEKPIGLIRSNGKRLVKLMEWDHGGILVSDRKGNVKIIPAQNRNQAGAWSEAVQSKPIIVYKGAVDIRKNPRDAEFNRVAVGYTLEGEMLVVGVFHSFSQASTLYDFAQKFKEIADSRGLKIHRAIALDGGAGAQIHIPSKGLLFGDSEGRTFRTPSESTVWLRNSHVGFE